jgi:hypothetical protein
MKNSRWILRSFAVAMLCTASGCKESYTVVTSLLPDGSCDRVITVTSDSGKVPDVAFPLAVDSSWEISWKAPTQKGEKYLFTARKHFAHFDSLRQEYARVSDSNKIRITIAAEKKFRWFYTYFSYNEKYAAFNPLTLLPLSEFMTADEVQRYLAGEKSDSLKKKRAAWEERSMLEEYYRGLVDAARRLNDPALPISLIESKKEELFAELNSSKSNDVTEETAAVLGTPVVRKLNNELKALLEGIVHRTEIGSKADGDYVSTVVMPGTILDTNAGEVKGNNVVWRFSDEYLSMADYEMRVESRTVNVWALTVTGVVVLLLIILPGSVRLRKARRLAGGGRDSTSLEKAE